jgi:hypothetical protein
MRRGEARHLVGEVGGRELEVAVGVDEAGKDDATVELDPLGPGREESLDLGLVPDGDDAPRVSEE